MNRNQKNKLKTLPNELTNQTQHFVFKSTCEDLASCASPTFASTEKLSNKEYESQLFLKENKNINNKKNTDLELTVGQNKKLVQKYQKLEEDHKRLNKKYEVCSKNLQGKLQKSVKKIYSKNTCEDDQEAVNLILQLKAMGEVLKEYKNQNKKLEEQKKEWISKHNEMVILIQNYKKKNEKLEQDKLKNKDQGKEVEIVRQKYEEKIKKIEEEKQREIRRKNEEYENLQFLKKQIQKKRNEDIKYKEEVVEKIKVMQEQERCFEEVKKQLQLKIMQLQKQTERQKGRSSQIQNKSSEELDEQRKKSKRLQKELLKAQRQLQEERQERSKKQRELIDKMREVKEEKRESEKQRKLVADLQSKIALLERENDEIKTEFRNWTQEKDKAISENYHEVEELKHSLNELKEWNEELQKEKISLGMDKKIEKEKNQKLEDELNIKSEQTKSYLAKIQELEDDKSRRTDFYDRNKPKTFPTKVVSQLKMIASTLSQILNLQDFEVFSMKLQNKENQVQSIVAEMTFLIEQAADYYDELNDQIRDFRRQIKNKEEIIVTLLKFTPEEKKNKIIQYLNVMENIEDQTADKVYKATCDILQQAEDWKNKLSYLFANLTKAEDQVTSLKKLLRNKDAIKRHEQHTQPYYLRKEHQTEVHYHRKEVPRRKYLQQ